MKKYLAYLAFSWKQSMVYKVDFTLGLISNLVFFFIYFALWQTIYTKAGITEISSYTLSSTITYYFITSFIFRFELNGPLYMGEEIWDGYFTNILVKPWNVWLSYAVLAINEIAVTILMYLPLWIFMYFEARQYIVFPGGGNAVMFAVTLLLAFVMNMFLNLFLNSLTFYFGDQESNIGLINYLAAFLGGGFFPLAFLTGIPARIFHVLPFRFLFDVPTSVYLGQLSSFAILKAWGEIVIWTFFFYLIFYFTYKKGLRRYTGTGR